MAIKKVRQLCLLLGIGAIATIQACSQKDSEENGTLQEQEVEVFSDESIYQLPGEWHTQDNDTVQLSQLQGKIPIIAMVFTNCGYACPRIVADMKNIEAQVPEDKIGKVVFVLVSFDTERDKPERLREFARQMQLGDQWLLLHGNEEEVRTLSMLLNVKYKKQPTGDFAHSNSITLLNKQGEVVTQVEGLGSSPQPILTKLKEI